MASIQTGIELNDGFTSVLNNIISSVNLAVSAMENMQGAMNADIDTSSLAGARSEIDQATIAVNELERAMSDLTAPSMDTPQVDMGTAQVINVDVKPSIPDPLIPDPQEIRPDVVPNAPPEPVDIPVEWQTDGLDVYTSSGMERFQQEVQSANTMLQQLSSTQDAIARQAFNTSIFPPEAVQNLNSMAVRIDNIRERIQQIENNPLNVGTDTANSELERLREQLNQAVIEQNELNAAMDDMDVSAANDAYLRLNQTISGTERYLRDDVDEQGRFNREIDQGVDSAGNLRSMIASAVGAFAGLAGIRKAIGWIEECTEAFDTQRNAELQLMTVLANTLDADYASSFAVETEVTADTSEAVAEINDIQNQVDDVTVTATANTKALTAAFDTITAKASEIQSKGIYGDEAMIAGAAEFSTYFSDTAAIEMMMDTLADYAMGMSGGGELDATAMVGYATGLGKIMSGSYDAMTEKGFEFTEAQKAVLEGTATQEQIIAAIGEEYLGASQDVQAAAAINAVIAESWDGLYESMSNTPEGKIIQMTNTFGDMKEVVGGQLYPYVILFVDAITSHWDTIQAVLDGITLGLQIMMGVLSWLLEGALNFAQVVIDNWSWISPIIYGIVAALAVYAAISGIVAVVNGIHAASETAKAAAQAMAAGATFAETTAQYGLNAALAACPLTWIILLIVALVAVLYAAVAAVNHFAGTSVSATGIICGAVAAAGAFILNTGIGVVNGVLQAVWAFVGPFIGIVEWILNVANGGFDSFGGAVANLIGNIISWFLSLGMVVTKIIDAIFGTDWTAGLSSLQDTVLAWGKNEDAVTLNRTAPAIDYRIGYEDAWDTGYSFGEGVDESIANFDPLSLFATEQVPSMDDFASTFGDAMAANGMAGDVGDISGNTGSIKDSLDCTEEDLKYLRDIAEQEAVNLFTLAEVKVEQTNYNDISNGMDLDGVMSGLTDAVNEAVDSITEGVHE